MGGPPVPFLEEGSRRRDKLVGAGPPPVGNFPRPGSATSRPDSCSRRPTQTPEEPKRFGGTCRTCRRTCRPGAPRRAEDLPDLPSDLPSRRSSQGGRPAGPAAGPAVQAILAGRKTCRRTCRPGAPRRVEDLPPRGALSHWVTESGIAGRRQWRLGFRTAATGNAEASWVQELGGGVFFVRPEGRWGNSLKGFFNLGRPPVEAPLQGTTGHRTTTWGVARLCGLRAFSTGQVTPAQSRFRSRF